MGIESVFWMGKMGDGVEMLAVGWGGSEGGAGRRSEATGFS